VGWLDAVGGFAKGVGEGAWDGVKGTVVGVGHLAEDGYKLATDGHYREQVWNSALSDARAAANFAATAVTDPGKAADEIGNTASHAWHALENAYNQAAAHGQSSEFIGQLFGQGAILVGSAFIPGGAEADAVGALGDAGRATELLGDAGKLANVTEDAGRLSALSGDAGKAVDVGNAIDATANGTHVVQLDDAAALKAAAEHAAPNTRYELGNYSWTTDAKGRTIEAEGQVELTPAGRDRDLQSEIGKEGAPTDVGFHLIGDRFNGPTNRLNVVPANGEPLADGLPNLNQGPYKAFENQIAKLASDPHNTVELRIRPQYNAGNLTNRPDEFNVGYRVNGGKWIEREFVNKR
jgi:DNA/RNA non-specific endonuclease